MPAFSFAPAFSLLAAFHRVSPVGSWRILRRHADEKLNPPNREPHVPLVRPAQADVLANGGAGRHQLATVLRETGRGRTPTIVLGGFVPDATEQVFLLRRFFLRCGDLYCVNFPRPGFSLDLICAQLDDLVAELAQRGQPPVIFSVSFGAGIVLEWLRRGRLAGRNPALAGVVFVSPVACVADVIAPGARKPATLLGRALRPYLDGTEGGLRPGVVEKSRTIFTRLFEAGAQNKTALHALMTPAEVGRLHGAVTGAIRGITAAGAHERVRALRAMAAPTDYFSPAVLPLAAAPALVLFAEDEKAVLDPHSPTRFAFEHARRAYFPHGRIELVRRVFGARRVQHASLIFHAFDFLPPIAAFYQRSNSGPLKRAA